MASGRKTPRSEPSIQVACRTKKQKGQNSINRVPRQRPAQTTHLEKIRLERAEAALHEVRSERQEGDLPVATAPRSPQEGSDRNSPYRNNPGGNKGKPTARTGTSDCGWDGAGTGGGVAHSSSIAVHLSRGQHVLASRYRQDCNLPQETRARNVTITGGSVKKLSKQQESPPDKRAGEVSQEYPRYAQPPRTENVPLKTVILSPRSRPCAHNPHPNIYRVLPSPFRHARAPRLRRNDLDRPGKTLSSSPATKPQSE